VQFDEDWSVPLDAIAVSGGLLMKNPKRYEIDTSGELPVLKIVGIKTSLVNAQYRIKSLSSNRMELSQIGGTAITPTPWEPTLVRLDTGNSQADSTPAEDTKAQPKPEPEFRKWTDTTGQFSVEAKFVGLKDGKVQLKKGNGTVLRIRAEIT